MSKPGAWLRGLATDLEISILFSTRLPLAHSAPIGGGDVARATWALPIAGALIGGAGALAYWTAFQLGLPSVIAAALALATTLVATGCLHEDGLADTADGFGGGNSLRHKLEIMRDSRIGTYGACSLTITFVLRCSALASIADRPAVATALIVAHASARAPLPIFMWFVSPARADGLAAEAGRPPRTSVAAAALLGILALLLGLRPLAAIIGLLLLTAAGILMGWLSMRQIGGQTGDVIGALEQINEILILLAAVVLLGA